MNPIQESQNQVKSVESRVTSILPETPKNTEDRRIGLEQESRMMAAGNQSVAIPNSNSSMVNEKGFIKVQESEIKDDNNPYRDEANKLLHSLTK